MTVKPIEQVLEENADTLLRIRGVVGVGIGDCSGVLCIRVFVRELTPPLAAQIPDSLEGYEVDVVETGEFAVPTPAN